MNPYIEFPKTDLEAARDANIEDLTTIIEGIEKEGWTVEQVKAHAMQRLEALLPHPFQTYVERFETMVGAYEGPANMRSIICSYPVWQHMVNAVNHEQAAALAEGREHEPELPFIRRLLMLEDGEEVSVN